MAVTAAQLVAQVKVEGVQQGKAELDKMSGAVEHTSGGFKSMLGNALSFAAGQFAFQAVGTAVGFLKDQFSASIKESTDAQDSMAKTVSILKHTHDASGMTAQAVADLAGNLSHLTKFSDDSVQSGENMLLTFDKIGKDTFPRATNAMLDLATTMKTGPDQAAIMLGKALQDPIAGMNAMTRVGVSFSAQQKDQIKTLIANNDLLGAQKIILKAVEGQTESATDAGKTASGQWAIFNQRLDDIRQTVGDRLQPILKQFLAFLNSNIGPAVDHVGKLFSSFQGMGKGISFGDIGKEILKIYPGIQKVADIFKGEFSTDVQFALKWAKQISQWFKSDMEPAIKQVMPSFISLSKALINNLAPALVKAWAAGQQIYRLFISDVIPIFEKVAPIVVKLAGFLADKLAQAIKFLAPYFNQAVDAVGKFAKEISDRVMPIINNFFDGLNKAMPTIKAIWNATWPVMASVLKGVWDMIAGVVKVAWAIVSGLIKIGLDILSGNWKQAWNDLLTMLGGVWDGIKTFLSGALRVIIQVILGKGQDVQDAVIKPFQQAYDFVTGLFGKLGGIINDTLSNIGKRINDLHIPGLPKFASGVENFGGGMAYVHAGEVITYLPPGSSVTPASKVSSMMSSQGKQPVQIIVNLAGRRVANALLPDLHQAIIHGVGGVI